MKLFIKFVLLLIVAAFCGLGYVAAIEVPIPKEAKTKTIPNSQIFND